MEGDLVKEDCAHPAVPALVASLHCLRPPPERNEANRQTGLGQSASLTGTHTARSEEHPPRRGKRERWGRRRPSRALCPKRGSISSWSPLLGFWLVKLQL
jgi:hypothetical protein